MNPGCSRRGHQRLDRCGVCWIHSTFAFPGGGVVLFAESDELGLCVAPGVFRIQSRTGVVGIRIRGVAS